jgi:hypothetical protein
MTSPAPCRPALLCAAATVLPVLLLGCASSTGTLELTSYKDPYLPETYQVAFNESAYYTGPGGDYHIVGRATHVPEDNPDGKISQLLHVHLFWKPWPGKTFDDPSTVDATIRYAILTEQGAAVYCGTGFVFPKKRRMSDKLLVKIENARLRLERQDGDAPDLLGSARAAGELVADSNAALAIDLRRELDLRAAPDEP